MARKSTAGRCSIVWPATWTYWGWKGGYFDTEEDARAFFDELGYMLATQKVRAELAAMVQHGPAIGPMVSTAPARATSTSTPSPRSWCSPRARMSIRSRMPASSSRSMTTFVNDGGIMDLWVREARLFKYGSGTGSNFSKLRGEGEKLSGGGRSSGLMSFLKIGDRAAGAIKSGGTTRARRQDGGRRHRPPRHREPISTGR